MSWFLSLLYTDRAQAVPSLECHPSPVLVVALLGWTSALAQDATVRGVVIDEVTGAPMPFVSVVVQGSATGVSTDLDGKFELGGVKPGVVNLAFSSIGYQPCHPVGSGGYPVPSCISSL